MFDIQTEIGNFKNKNKILVIDKTMQELRNELLKKDLSSVSLSVDLINRTLYNVNSCIGNRGCQLRQ